VVPERRRAVIDETGLVDWDRRKGATVEREQDVARGETVDVDSVACPVDIWNEALGKRVE
jgi:hypothetical protein